MLIVLVNWLFIFVICFGFGWCGRVGLRQLFPFPCRSLHPALHLLLGLTLLITACNLVSFVGRIHWEVNIGFTLLALVGIFFHRKEATSEFKNWLKAVADFHFLTKVAFLLLAIIAILKTVSPSEIPDEGGYHIPLIRWMENYAIVPGIANIEDRMGFNPSKYIADAFFSFTYWFPGGLYELNGFLFLLLNGWFLSSFERLMRGKFEVFYSDLIAVLAMIFQWRFYLTSVDADYLNIFLGLICLLLLLKMMEDGTMRQANDLTVLSAIFLALLVTVKFSSLLLALPFLVHWLPLVTRKKPRFFIAKLMGIACLIFLPWLCRNYIISGYPIYPLYYFKLGEPEWQVLPEIVKGQFEYIREYAKTEMECPVNDYRVGNLVLAEWFPDWFQQNAKQQAGKLIFIGLPLGILIFLTFGVKQVVGKTLQTDRLTRQNLLIFSGLLFLTIVFWFSRFPAIRLFWSGLAVFIFLGIGLTIRPWVQRKKGWLQLGLCLILFAGLLRSAALSWVEMSDIYHLATPAAIRPLETYRETMINEQLVKIAPDNQCYDAIPPCFPRNFLRGLQLRGDSIHEGFKVIK